MSDLSSPQMGELLGRPEFYGYAEVKDVTLHDTEIDQIMDKIEAQRAMNNRFFCDWLRLTFKCPHCGPKAKALQAQIRAGDQKITQLNELLCA